MKPIDFVAIIGALAWLPHLIKIIKGYITKPEIRIITQKTAEVGFTTFGPIFNTRVAFSVKYHDIVISNFKAIVQHESGEKRIFEWQGIKQEIAKMTTRDGPIPYEKENSVLAIKLNQKEVEERSIQCQEISFIKEKKHYEDKTIKKLSYDREQTNYDPVEFLKCQESTDLYSFIKQSFSWKAGKYKVKFEIESPEKFKLLDNEYEFSLIPIDIEQLEKNKNSIEQDHINMFVSSSHEKFKEVVWNWRYPILRSSQQTSYTA